MQPLYTEQLYLTKKERQGIFMLLIILVLFIGLPFFWKSNSSTEIKILNPDISSKKDSTFESSEQKSTMSRNIRLQSRKSNDAPQIITKFNPNTVDYKTAINLGIPKKIFNILNKFRQKGFIFKKIEDFKKIYGVDDQLFNKLSPLIDLPVFIHDSLVSTYKEIPPPKVKQLVEINSATLDQWISMPGIGHKLAERIVKFRDALGGFYSIEQVKETYGILDSSYQKFKTFLRCDMQIKKLTINHLDVDELRLHPYIQYKQALFITDYRRQHGGFKSLEEMYITRFFDTTWIEKVKPYLSFD